MSYCNPIVQIQELKVKIKGLFFIVFCLLLIPAQLMAGSFRVSPVKLYMDFKTKTTFIKITNNDDKKVTIQLNAKEWYQKEESPDKYEETKDFVLFPKIVTIEKGEERIIRVGYKGENGAAEEKAYRLFLEELPAMEQGELMLVLPLRIAVPIFVSPPKEVKAFSVEKVLISKGKLAIKVKNNGNIHLVIGKITALGLDNKNEEVFKTEGNGWYVLASVTKTFEIDLTAEDCRKADKIRVLVEDVSSKLKEEIILDKVQCVDGKENEKSSGGQFGR